MADNTRASKDKLVTNEVYIYYSIGNYEDV